MIESKFKVQPFFIVVFFLFGICFLAYFLSILVSSLQTLEQVPIIGIVSYLLSLILLLFACVYAVVYYSKLLLQKITLEDQGITYKRFAGAEVLSFSDIKGYKTFRFRARGRSSESFYIIKSDGSRISFSQSTHKNYGEMRAFCRTKMNNLGRMKNPYWEELKYLFRF